MIIKKGKSIREKVYDILRDMIIDGKINPGERIIETEYCNKFQISRTPLREAIRMLELEGLVESQNTGGVIVKKVTKQEIYEIYKMRIALESIILEETIKNITKDDVKRIEEILKETEDAFRLGQEDTVFMLFSEFNKVLYEIAKLPRVTAAINNINSYMRRFRKLSVTNSVRKKIAYEDHVAILRAVKDHDLAKAMEINKQHLEKSMNFILGQFTTDGEEAQ